MFAVCTGTGSVALVVLPTAACCVRSRCAWFVLKAVTDPELPDLAAATYTHCESAVVLERMCLVLGCILG